jgi:hypothetical protein
VASVGAVDPHGFEVRRVDFRFTEEGRTIAEQKAAKYPELFGQLREAAEHLRQAGDLDYVKLSIAAKTLFMLRERKALASEPELGRLARHFGWSVSPDQIREAVDYLRRLRLVTRPA